MDDNKVAVLIEDLMSKFRTFGEGLDGLRDEMNNRFNNLEQKVDKLEFKLDAHIEQDRRDHLQLMQLIKETDIEVQELKRIK
ncbi:MAG: hypothetical protein ACM3X9_00975 [Bacillota bacterium]